MAAGLMLGHLRALAPGAPLSHLRPPRPLWESPHLGLSEAAIRNLELVKSLRDGSERGTLISVIDRAATPMGSRLIRSWLLRPLKSRPEIEERHEAVSELTEKSLVRDEIRALLKEIRDPEKSVARLSLGRGAVKDLLLVRGALRLAPKIQELAAQLKSPAPKALAPGLAPPAALARQLERELKDQSDVSPGGPEGGWLPEGLSPRLDELRALESGGRQKIAEIGAEEKAATGISSLKTGYTRVFGYYLEVSKRDLPKVPERFQRRQTLASHERFVTERLLAWEEKIVSASEKRESLEGRILETLKRRAAAAAPLLQGLSESMAGLDALCSLSLAAERSRWVRPKMAEDDVIEIRGGRHPMVEASLPRGSDFVSNDLSINQKERLLIITGPNMSGKSTILRQTALAVILAQMGSFVPAESARLSPRDHVFIRAGASDDLSGGLSTFMVEMTETAKILKHSTPRSLIILDEVGRGTSTFDGVAIAWAVAEHLHDRPGRPPAVLFATHYHELTELPRSKPQAANYNVAVKSWGGKIVFLRKLIPGGASRSYGIAVAQLAGLPKAVIRRAGEVLADLAKGSRRQIRPGQAPRPLFSQTPEGPPEGRPGESSARGAGALELARELADVNTDDLTPLEALAVLSGLRDKAGGLLS
jgi:DNA mismatch repair protein MutS